MLNDLLCLWWWGTCVCAMVYMWRQENDFQESVLSSAMCILDWTQVWQQVCFPAELSHWLY